MLAPNPVPLGGCRRLTPLEDLAIARGMVSMTCLPKPPDKWEKDFFARVRI